MAAQTTLLPRIRLRRCAAWPGPDLVELRQHFRRQDNVERTQIALELCHRAWPDDRRGHGRLMQQPCQRNVGRRLPNFGAQPLVSLQLRAVLLDGLLDTL